MRLGINTVKFTGNLTDLKKFLEKKVEEEELKKILEEKDKEDEKAMREYMFQNDNQEFSG